MKSKVVNIFKPEDFKHEMHVTYEGAANSANEKLNALIESWPVVYSYSGENDWFISRRSDGHITHKARVSFIEPIVRETCKHEPIEIENNIVIATNPPQYPPKKYKCRYCGVELQATWSEKK